MSLYSSAVLHSKKEKGSVGAYYSLMGQRGIERDIALKASFGSDDPVHADVTNAGLGDGPLWTSPGIQSVFFYSQCLQALDKCTTHTHTHRHTHAHRFVQ